MKRILALMMAAGLCGCSAGLMQTGSVWTGSRIPAGAEIEYAEEEEAAGFGGRLIARLGMSILTFNDPDPGPKTSGEKVDGRLTLGVGYTMTFEFGDVEVGLDFVPDMADWFDNIYYNLRADYIYWVGETGIAATAGLGFFIESNAAYENEGGETPNANFFLHIDLGGMYLIPESAFDARLALQFPIAGADDVNVPVIIMLTGNYAF